MSTLDTMLSEQAFIQACAPAVAVQTMQALIKVESDSDPLALSANRSGRAVRLQVDNITEAIQLAKAEIKAGNTVDIGLAQINSANLKKLGYSVERAFDPCANLRGASEILSSAYAGAVRLHGEGQTALRAALSAYNTGDYQRGFSNGYVARYYDTDFFSGAKPYTADVYGADPTVLMQNQNSTSPAIITEYAEAFGLMEDDAMSEQDAWESNGDEHTMELPHLRGIENASAIEDAANGG